MEELRERIEGRDVYTEDGIREINRDCTFLINLHSMASFALSFLTWEHRLGCHRYNSSSSSLKKKEVKGKQESTSQRKANSVCGRNGRKHEVCYLGRHLLRPLIFRWKDAWGIFHFEYLQR